MKQSIRTAAKTQQNIWVTVRFFQWKTQVNISLDQVSSSHSNLSWFLLEQRGNKNWWEQFSSSAWALADEGHFILSPEPERAHASLPTLYAAPVVTWILCLLAFAKEQWPPTLPLIGTNPNLPEWRASLRGWGVLLRKEHNDQGRDGLRRLFKIRLNISSPRHPIILCQTTAQFSVNYPIKIIITAN